MSEETSPGVASKAARILSGELAIKARFDAIVRTQKLLADQIGEFREYLELHEADAKSVAGSALTQRERVIQRSDSIL